MSDSSALKTSFEAPQFNFDNLIDEGLSPKRDLGGSEVVSFPLRAPSFDKYVYAATARKAARINASSVTEAEHTELLAERENLLNRLFEGSISKREENRLDYVRWSLDRIEDARHGDALDELEGAIARYEQFQADLARLSRQLGIAKSSTSKRDER